MKKQRPIRLIHHFRHAPQGLRAVIAVMLSLGMGSTGLQAQGPVGGTVRGRRHIVTVDAGLTVAATDGTVNFNGHGLFAGTGDIGVYAGSTLDTGVTTTTGALTLASTNGDSTSTRRSATPPVTSRSAPVRPSTSTGRLRTWHRVPA